MHEANEITFVHLLHDFERAFRAVTVRIDVPVREA